MTKLNKKPKVNKKIVIVGGGFGGIRCALDLVNQNLPGIDIILISDKSHFEYTPALYRVVTGRSPLEVCIPLREIFDGKDVEVLEDSITEVNVKEKKLKGSSGSKYSFDFLLLALGSETAYFEIPGLRDLCFGFKSINEALGLKRHLHELFSNCEKATMEEKVCSANIVIVGGGATGTELAGELALYTRELAKKHNLKPSLVTIDLIEASPRLIPVMPEDVSKILKKRLHSLGVNIFLNRAVIKREMEQVYLKDMEMKTKTVIWTAGVKTNHLYSQVKGLSFDKKGRVLVDKFLQVKGFPGVFIIGDAASTPYTGLAQTAISDGCYVANSITRKLRGKPPFPYQPKKPAYALPLGPGWAVVLIGPFRIYGILGWWLRQLADLRFFLSILPFLKAILAFQSGKTLCEQCAICAPEGS